MMIKLPWSFFICEFLLLFLASSETIEAPIFNGYQITALLPFTGVNRFNLEAEAWTSSGMLRSSKISLCAGYLILGGPNALENGGYFMNQFDNLPPHDVIYYFMRFFLIGSWSSTVIISLSLDSKTIEIGNLDLMSSQFSSKTCDGATWSTRASYTILGKLFHSDSSLTLKIMSDLTTSPALANVGVRDIYMLFANKTASDTETYCFRNQEVTITTAVPNKCFCAKSLYQNPLNSAQCLNCNPSCYDCFGPSASECFLCNQGYSFQGTQCIRCDTSCVQCSGPASNQCVTCSANRWLYWDHTCRTSCTSPTTRQVKYDDLWICELPCPEGQYMLYDGTCVNYCDDPLVAVTNSTGVFCNKPCVDGEFVYTNGSCYGSCDLPFVEGVTLDVDTCYWKCDSDQYMRWDWSCWDSCDDPLEVKTNSTGDFCFKPCEDGEFWYTNGSCIGSCDLPFETGAILDADVCLWKCDSGQYMRWDWICWDSCDDPLEVKTNSTGDFCFKPCEDGEFLYSNGSCIAGTCEFPFEQGVALSVVDTCLFKCDSDEFLYENDESCVKTCKFPFLQRDGEGAEGKYCYSPCSSTEFILADRSCSTDCSSPNYYSERIDNYTQLCLASEDYKEIRTIAKVIKTEGQISFGLMMALGFGRMGSSNSLCLASLAKMLEYIKYMRIDYSERLDLMFQLQGSSELSLSFEVPLSEGIQKKFPDHELPWNFEEYELGSSFFLNYWETFGTLLVIFAGILGLLVLTTMTKGKIYHSVFLWLRTVFKWNFLLMIFCSNFDGVVFFTSLEMRTLHIDSFAAFFSVFTCIIANILAVAVLGRIAFILKDIRKLKYLQVHDISAKPRKINPHQKWKNYQVLFLNCQEKKPVQQAFFIIFLARVYFFHLTIGYIFPDPLVQSVIITCLSVFMLTYLITQRPLEEKWDFIKMIINELIVLTVNLCVLVLAALNHNGKQTKEQTELFSEIIIIANIVFNSIALISLSIEALIALFKIYKKIKAHKLKGITSLLEIFMMIFAGEAMVMEEEHSSPETNVKKIPVKQKQKTETIELESPNEKNSELLKLQSPKSYQSLIYDEKPSGVPRSRVLQHSTRLSEVVLKSGNYLKELEESEKRTSILIKSENMSGVLLSPQTLKGSLVKIDMTSENSKLLFDNSPQEK